MHVFVVPRWWLRWTRRASLPACRPTDCPDKRRPPAQLALALVSLLGVPGDSAQGRIDKQHLRGCARGKGISRARTWAICWGRGELVFYVGVCAEAWRRDARTRRYAYRGYRWLGRLNGRYCSNGTTILLRKVRDDGNDAENNNCQDSDEQPIHENDYTSRAW